MTGFKEVDRIVRLHEGAEDAVLRAFAPHMPPVTSAPFDQRVKRGSRA